jgi:class 3 adenylate cyclase
MPYYLFTSFTGCKEFSLFLLNRTYQVYSVQKTGSTETFYNRSFLHNLNIFELPASSLDSSIAAIRVYYNYTAGLQLFAADAPKLVAHNHRVDLVGGIFLGVCIIILFYNFVSYVQLGDHTFLIYSLWLFLFSFTILNYQGFSYQFLWPRLPKMNNYYDSLSALSVIAHHLLILTIFNVRKHSKILFITCLSIIFFSVIVIILNIGFNKFDLFPFSDAGWVIFLSMLNVIAVAVYFTIRRFSYAIYFLFGILAISLSIFLTLLSAATGLIHLSTVSEMNMLYYGAGLEVFFYAITLTSRVRLLKETSIHAEQESLRLLNENSRLIREQNVLLELEVEERTKEIRFEKQKSDNLLLNIFPEQIAIELKETGTSPARQFDHVTVLFTDFVNFTGISEKLNPTKLVAEINSLFSEFDTIMDKHGLEKIKTIGDAYLAICGLPNEKPDHAERTIKAAIDILKFMKHHKSGFEIRIGVNSGPVVAGIVGLKKYAYDVWGDTVNTAARMEQSGEAGQINISGTTHNLICHVYNCIYRGKINAKNKGEIDMYFVEI